jgi:predicted RNA-binding Zn-ribbon protein involved in translation (DUF1610 family)
MSNIAQNQKQSIEFDCPNCGSPTEIEAPTLNAMWESEADRQYQCPACQESYILPDRVAELSGIIYEKDGPQDCVVSMSGDCLWVTHVETGQRQVIKDEYLADIRLPNKWSPVTIDKQGRKLVGIPLTEKELADHPGGFLNQWKEGWITLALADTELDLLRDYVDQKLCQKNPDLLKARRKKSWKKVGVGIWGILCLVGFICFMDLNDGQSILFTLFGCAILLGISGGIELIRLNRITTSMARDKQEKNGRINHWKQK